MADSSIPFPCQANETKAPPRTSSGPLPPLRILVCMATYNEVENLPRLVPAILAAVPEADLLVVDDNSPDGTGQWCQEFARNEPRLRLHGRPRKLGVGSANVAAIRHAIQGGYHLLVTLDADLSHDPSQLPELLRPFRDATQEVDVVIGSRYVAGGVIENWSVSRRLISRLVNLFCRFILGLPVADCSSGYRCYRVSTLADLPLARWESTGYAFYEEVLWQLHRNAARLREVPIRFVDRALGRSKAGWRESLHAASELFGLAFRLSIWRIWR